MAHIQRFATAQKTICPIKGDNDVKQAEQFCESIFNAQERIEPQAFIFGMI
jgi:hypothetical protein